MTAFTKSAPLSWKLLALSVLFVGVIAAFNVGTSSDLDKASIYEIRSYHIDPAHLDAYKTWITTHGLPHIREHLDVVGFWIQGDVETEVNGAPLDDLGSGNVSWVIRWESKEVRDKTWSEVFSTPEWQEVFAKFPGGGDAYLRVEARFFDAI